MPFSGVHSSQFITGDLAQTPDLSFDHGSTSPASSSSSSPFTPCAEWPVPRRTRSPSAPSCTRDVYNVPSLHLASVRKPSVGKLRTRVDRSSLSGAAEADERRRRGSAGGGGVVRRRGSAMELEMAPHQRRPSVADVVMEGSLEELPPNPSQEMLRDDEDATIDHDLSTCGVPNSPKPFTTPLEALPPAPTTPFLQSEHHIPSRPLLPEAPCVFPLGQPSLRISFCPEEGENPVPPCFYPGQTIPTTLMFELPRYTTLPHCLNPALTMSLVGALRCRATEADEGVAEDGMIDKELINVSVSLEEGLKLWAKDAGSAWQQLSERKKRGRANPADGLPGGRYTLPLTVQVPTHPRLPPSFNLPGSVFQIVYQLRVNLTLDRPADPSDPCSPASELERVHLVQTTRHFDLLPITLPASQPTLPSLKGLLQVTLPALAEPEPALVGLGITAQAGWMDKLQQAFEPIRHSLGGTHHHNGNSRSPSPPVVVTEPTVASWSIVPSLPTTTFSPSSNIPVDIVLRAPSAAPSAPLPEGHLLIKAAVIRREHAFSSLTAPSALEESRGLVSEHEIIASSGYFDLAALAAAAVPSDGAHSRRIALPRLNLPLGYGDAPAAWTCGMTTSLTVSPDPTRPQTDVAPLHTHCSSRFYVALHVAFSPSPLPSTSAPATNAFSLDTPILIPSVLRSRSLLVPITLGSVGEPRGARHRRSWRELYLARDEATGEEAPTMVGGSAVDDERGWLVPPPSYQEALLEQEYVL